ncbi:MBL fold metallo-hydrolase [Paenibacillus sp. GCM10027628]|uniref:MBL fold metallo-hydrolase n=1 Tax=Paenibacillus sp. GCM10027628 TaxID=3273413 RepID=UPI00363CFE67
MKFKEIMKDVYLLPLGNVNAYLVKEGNELILIDTGAVGNASNITAAIKSIGCQPRDLKAILLTHCHPDHAGSAAALKREAPQATIYAGVQDAPILEQGLNQRTMTASPGIMNKLLFRIFVSDNAVEAVAIDIKLSDQDIIQLAGGIKAVAIPGHCQGQLAYLLPSHGGVLFAADAASNIMGLGFSIGHEDIEVAKQSLRKLGEMEYNIACFGHGKPIMKHASRKFRKKWGSR